jgi:hypothetical protein
MFSIPVRRLRPMPDPIARLNQAKTGVTLEFPGAASAKTTMNASQVEKRLKCWRKCGRR